MPRKPSTPKYTHHKASGQARVRLGGHDVYLGPHGSPESHEKYRWVIAEFMAARSIPVGKDRRRARPDLSINELILRHVTWAEGYYRNGTDAAVMLCSSMICTRQALLVSNRGSLTLSTDEEDLPCPILSNRPVPLNFAASSAPLPSTPA